MYIAIFSHLTLLHENTSFRTSAGRFISVLCRCAALSADQEKVSSFLPKLSCGNQTGGGGGVESTPLDVSHNNSTEIFCRASRFRNFFLSSLAQLLTLFSEKSAVPFQSYAMLRNRASAQNMGIFWICVQNIWKMAFCAKNLFWALKVCNLPWF